MMIQIKLPEEQVKDAILQSLSQISGVNASQVKLDIETDGTNRIFLVTITVNDEALASISIIEEQGSG
jgi:hypothetical protein